MATLSVFVYFIACLFGRQYLIPRNSISDILTFDAINVNFTVNEPYKRHTPDVYIPFYTLLEFICYFGWIKVAETLLNPFGDDDEDFQINYLIDRNFQVSYLIIDEAMTDLEMNYDPFMDHTKTCQDINCPLTVCKTEWENIDHTENCQNGSCPNQLCQFGIPPAELPYVVEGKKKIDCLKSCKSNGYKILGKYVCNVHFQQF